MNNEGELKPLNNRDISIGQGNYFENIGGDYNDYSTYYISEPKPNDPITGIPNNLPSIFSNNFVGREDELTRLHELLQSNKTVAISAVAGMGGVGKTELVLQYALQYQEEYSGSICWLRAREDIGVQIVNFAKSLLNLNIPEDWDLATQVRYCWGHWREGNSLIVLDDLPNYSQYYEENIEQYLTFNHKSFNLLITSRQQPEGNIEYLDLDVLAPEAAAELIISLAKKSQIDFEKDKSKLLELCEWLGYLPLGLELVGIYLNLHPSYSIETVIEKLEKSKLEARALRRRKEIKITAQLSVAAAFELSWKDITEELKEQDHDSVNYFQELAGYLSLFKSEPFVWILVEYGLLGSEESESKEEQIEELEELRDRYLIKRNLLKRNSNGTYQLHSLIQEYFRAQLESLEQAESLKQIFTLPMIAIAQSIPQTPTQEDLSRVALAIPHLSNVASELIDYVSDDNLIWAFEGLGRFYQGQGIYNLAEYLRKESLKVCRNRLGQEHPNVAASLNNLALLYELQGIYEEAEPLLQQALELLRKLLGQEHPNVAASLDNLAGLYDSQGRYEEAEPLYQQALEMRRKLLGQEHPDVATSLNNLAVLYLSQGRYEEAEPLYQQALELYRKLLGQEHSLVANSLNNLALLYESQGRYEEAKPLFQQALEMRRKLLGDEHPSVATSLDNLAGLYESQGRYEEAEPLYQQALELYRKLLGQEHPLVATSLNNLAVLYLSQGRYNQAEPLFQQALELFRKLLGQEHPLVATSFDNLAGLYYSQGRYDQAKPLLQQALEMRRKLLGQEHPSVATSLNNLAGLYKSQGRYDEAEHLFQQALAIAEKALGENHPHTTSIKKNLQYIFMMKLIQLPEAELKQLLPTEAFEQILQIKQQIQSSTESTERAGE